MFEAKLHELTPALKSKKMKKQLLYALERLCKNFLMVVLKEKPSQIQMGTMNLHNFDKAIKEMYEFNQTLETSVEQLYLNREKLNSTINQLIEFCLHIDTQQYGFDFSGEVSENPVKQKAEKDKIKQALNAIEADKIEHGVKVDRSQVKVEVNFVDFMNNIGD